MHYSFGSRYLFFVANFMGEYVFMTRIVGFLLFLYFASTAWAGKPGVFLDSHLSVHRKRRLLTMSFLAF